MGKDLGNLEVAVKPGLRYGMQSRLRVGERERDGDGGHSGRQPRDGDCCKGGWVKGPLSRSAGLEPAQPSWLNVV